MFPGEPELYERRCVILQRRRIASAYRFAMLILWCAAGPVALAQTTSDPQLRHASNGFPGEGSPSIDGVAALASPLPASGINATAQNASNRRPTGQAFVNNLSPGETAVKDHVSDPANWDGGKLIQDYLIHTSSEFNKVAGAAFTGNGDELSRVGLIWAHWNDNLVANQGDSPSILSWRFAFYNDSADFAGDAFRLNPPQPNYFHVFAQPSNPDWLYINGDPAQGLNIVGQSGIVSNQIFNLFYAEFDVSFLHIQTTPGQQHLISIVPTGPLFSDINTLVSLSSGVNAIGTDLDWFEGDSPGGNIGPDTIHNIGFLGGGGFDFAAFKVVTIGFGACCVDGACQDNAGAGIDRTTCEQTLGGVFQGHGSTCATASCIVVPAASNWGIVAMTLLMLTSVTVVYSRRWTEPVETP